MSDSPPIPPSESLARRLGKIFAALFLLTAILLGGYEGYRSTKLHLALKNARREAANRQFMRAEFWTNRAFSLDPGNVTATRLMAEINEAQDRPQALGWRIRVTQRAPGNNADTLAWAKSAFRFGQREMALNALQSLPADFQNHSADYHELLAGCALASHELSAAEEHFAKAAELDPVHPTHRINLAAFRLTNSPRPEIRAAAAQQLDAALADPTAGIFALRVLLTNAIRTPDHPAAQKYAAQLRALPEHTFNDDITCLEAALGDPTFPAALQDLQHRADSDPLQTGDLGTWLNTHGQAAETLRWFAQLPPPLQANTRLQMTTAEAYLTLADWPGLQAYLAPLHWDDGEFLRRAALIRSQRELGQPWEKDWNQLATDAKACPPDGYLLAQTLMAWKWRAETIALLWEATKQPITNSVALENLWDLFSQTSETREMLRVVRAQMALDPSNPIRKNNEAFLSLLLYGPSLRAERLAGEATAANPQVPEWAATYAYALHLAGKDAQAKKVLSALPPEALHHPGVALYHAIILAATGDPEAAKAALTQLSPQGLLPEERKLANDLADQLQSATSR